MREPPTADYRAQELASGDQASPNATDDAASRTRLGGTRWRLSVARRDQHSGSEPWWGRPTVRTTQVVLCARTPLQRGQATRRLVTVMARGPPETCGSAASRRSPASRPESLIDSVERVDDTEEIAASVEVDGDEVREAVPDVHARLSAGQQN